MNQAFLQAQDDLQAFSVEHFDKTSALGLKITVPVDRTSQLGQDLLAAFEPMKSKGGFNFPQGDSGDAYMNYRVLDISPVHPLYSSVRDYTNDNGHISAFVNQVKLVEGSAEEIEARRIANALSDNCQL